MALRPAVFLDRDGVINERRFLFVRSVDQFRFRRDSLEALRRLAASEYLVVVATNQPIVGWRLASADALDAIHARMVAEVEAAGGRIDRIEVCPYGPGEDAECRKPRPGMLLRAASALGINLRASWMVGDNRKDMVAGRTAGCRTVLVNATLSARLKSAAALADHAAPNLSGAVDCVLGPAPRVRDTS